MIDLARLMVFPAIPWNCPPLVEELKGKMDAIVLDAEGFEVVVASDAASGLRAAYQTHPDIILLDVMMPGVDGFELCRRLRGLTDVPIIFVTAMATIEDTIRGLWLACAAQVGATASDRKK
jgi:DNA-binding response OmpR family regulator